MARPIVSIITPTYQHASVIGECISSVLAQNFTSWEQIIVDDGSDDGTLARVLDLARADDRIKVIAKKHRGIEKLAESYNCALAKCRGEFIAILEGDDFWPSDKLAVQVSGHREASALFSYGHVAMVVKGQQIGEYPLPPVAGVRDTETYLKWVLTKRSYIMPVSALISTNALKAIGGFSQGLDFPAVDFPTWLKLFQLPGRVVYLDQVLGYWRQGPAQVTQQYSVELAEQGLQLALKTVLDLPKQTTQRLGLSPELIRYSFRGYLGSVYWGCLLQALRNNDRQQATRWIRKLSQCGGAETRIRAIAGLLLAHSPVAVEDLARWRRQAHSWQMRMKL